MVVLVDLCVPVLVLFLFVQLCVCQSVLVYCQCLSVAVVVVIDVLLCTGLQYILYSSSVCRVQCHVLMGTCLSLYLLSVTLIICNSPDSFNFTDDLLNNYPAPPP